ncbi:uncharacterized protein LOC9633539 [Selaginella moellendorffii]|uniref:uncharacterized protein LOC9633539 n=1 Tax=Selaginella moellendorffii TaxID=88036 RepID=UPI000D1CA915|nr:uncharacterized protein LOC9633539 [Selaginella moellendorffii]|eukprot:XP_024528492.1 uncharacterized protein LOC9633539 [Selaginella moellendorffii]
MVDDVEAEYIREVMKRRRSSKELRMPAAMALGDSGVPEFQARLLALRMAVKDYELPMQLAYDELEDLAANTERVKSVIEKNMTLLTVQMRKRNFRYYKSAFLAWIFYVQRKLARRVAMRNARDYALRRRLGRAFDAWHICWLRMHKFKKLQLSAQNLLRRHSLKRIWRAWSSLVKKRLREDEKRWREKQLVRDLNVRQRGCVRQRAVNAIKRRRLHQAFFAFKIGLEILKDTRSRRNHIFYIVTRRKVAVGFKLWERYPRKRERDLRVIQRRQRRVAQDCIWTWDDETSFLKFRRRRMRRCRLSIAFEMWRLFISRKMKYDTIATRIIRARLKRYFTDLREICLEEIWKRRTCERARRKCTHLRTRWFFEAWITYMQIQLQERSYQIEEYAAVLENENQKTRSECDRMGRIIDTGEWDQQRIVELDQASLILNGEKEALLKLAARLEGEHKEAMDYQRRQEQEINTLKNEMLGCNYLRKNKLLVKGASSFNSVLRAVKSEAIKEGVNPEVVKSIDEKCMDQVIVFPDGDLRVRPIRKYDKGKWKLRPEATTSTNSSEDSFDS